ncbi:RagB/SusD family nutrient uptake outer membrane protein [Niabella beijingensis]|uniref:RagB/SusD family nutrient uptake outer membrane protein n=1 Tax=Niabella beijingensis TaxID=2872700 RepID=UPI001CBF716D|nr:RagB/SusD family nutrient uptake outer membrane protein [Niabella beijingensis]MBZ4191697.1 RagB/SusD family nutrient uptake outer membrane protein [Niabella beijingensis]
MRKSIFGIIVSLLLLQFFGSCKKYMDMEHFFKDRQNLDTVFARRDYTEQWLADVFTHLRLDNMDVGSKDYVPTNLISDDMFFGDRGDEFDSRTYKMYKNGEYTENSWQDSWASCYQGIRKASIFIDNVDKNRQMTKAEITDRKAQARFLRAYYYWLLLRKYGPVPLVPEEGLDYTKSYDELSLPRNTYDECVDFITKELALAAQDLPTGRDGRNVVRPTKGAALAARAKIYLYAASPLFNGNTEMADLTDGKGRQLIPQQYNEEKWARAAAAAKEVMDLGIYKIYTYPYHAEDQGPDYPPTIIPPFNAKYSNSNFPAGWKDIDPFESYRSLFNGSITFLGNPEIIFSRVTEIGDRGVNDLPKHQTPQSMGGWNAHGITQKQCDAYTMNDGSDVPLNPRVPGFTEDNTSYKPLPAGVSLQYANREPRFYASVAYNGSIWYRNSLIDPNERSQQVFYYRGSPDGKRPASPQFYIRTGLGIKKYVNPMDSWGTQPGSYTVPKTEPAIRYAEVLLIYAEALNELNGAFNIPAYDGKTSIAVARNTAEMSAAISQIRIRGGVPDYDAGIYASKELFRKSLKRERQVELLGENHRYYDLRRWKDAPVEEATPVMGCNMDMTDAQRELFHTPIIIASLPTVFVRKMYLWPIPHAEMRRNVRLTQNPGWTNPY